MAENLGKLVAEGALDSLRMRLEEGAVVDERDEMDCTPLHHAATVDSIEAASLLLDHAADINARDCHGLSPLHCAAENGHQRLVELLLARGASVGLRDNDGQTPLHAAAAADEDAVVALLISHGALVDALDVDGCTPLHLAAEEASSETISALLEVGADPTIRNTSDETALEMALRAGNSEAATRLHHLRGRKKGAWRREADQTKSPRFEHDAFMVGRPSRWSTHRSYVCTDGGQPLFYVSSSHRSLSGLGLPPDITLCDDEERTMPRLILRWVKFNGGEILLPGDETIGSWENAVVEADVATWIRNSAKREVATVRRHYPQWVLGQEFYDIQNRTGRQIGVIRTMSRLWSWPYVLDLSGDPSRSLDRRLALAIAVLCSPSRGGSAS